MKQAAKWRDGGRAARSLQRRRRQTIATVYELIGGRFRRRRMRRFADLLRLTSQTTILDVGGAPRTWLDLQVHPLVTILNLDLPEGEQQLPPGMSLKIGDAARLPYFDKSFDIAFSNSVIEHVGDISAQADMADELRRVAASYYLQTPARSFPIEPHYMAPFVHWFPRSIQRRILRNFSVWGWITRPSQSYVDDVVSSTRLLTRRELQRLFPDGIIAPERVCGLTKSWTVTRIRVSGAAVRDGDLSETRVAASQRSTQCDATVRRNAR